jgi:hypothetical protein
VTAGRDRYFILDITEDNDGPTLHVVTPSSVLVVRDAEDLQQKLDAFSDPIKSGVVKNNPKARRWYVEKTLPALRYYCEHFDLDVPDWLVDNSHWEGMSREQQVKLFGPGPLKLREFQQVNAPDIAVVREEQDQEQPGG